MAGFLARLCKADRNMAENLQNPPRNTGALDIVRFTKKVRDVYKRQGIDRGWLNAVSSDHCALVGGFEKKKEGLEDFTKIPNGIPGVQNRISPNILKGYEVEFC